MMLIKLCAAIALAAISLIDQIHGQFAHYGESCEAEDPGTDSRICDLKETLSCVNGTCECGDPTTMVYDPGRGLCVGKAGHRCVFHLTEASVPTTKRNPCVVFASCESDFGATNSTCRCWSSFYPDAKSGACVRKRGYLQKCEKDEECNGRKGFVCNVEMGICTCDSKSTLYNPDTERCVGLPNHDCVNVYRECTENHKCKSGVCRCKFKEVEAQNGTLLCESYRHKYGKACGRFRGECGDESANNMRCLDGKCRCKNPDYQIYDNDRRICVSKVGGPCTLSPSSVEAGITTFRNGSYANSKFSQIPFPITQCISYAECVSLSPKPNNIGKHPISEQKRGTCECGESFIENKKGLCTLPFGADCDTSTKDKKDQCTDPLKCVSNRCGCQNDIDVYESEGRRCAKPVRALCWKDNSCVKNAACLQTNKKLPGRCGCVTKFKSTPLGTCYVSSTRLL